MTLRGILGRLLFRCRACGRRRWRPTSAEIRTNATAKTGTGEARTIQVSVEVCQGCAQRFAVALVKAS